MAPRQRLRARITRPALGLGKLLVVVVAAVLFWYGLMVVLLAFQVDPTVVQDLSAYRTIYDGLAGLTPSDIDTTVRIIAGVVGFVVFVAFGALAFEALPRPYLARQDLLLARGERGSTVVEPRALERLAGVAAEQEPAVEDARGRSGPLSLDLDVSLCGADALAESLQAIQARVRDAVRRHDLPEMSVNVTLAGVQRPESKTNGESASGDHPAVAGTPEGEDSQP